MTTAATTPHSGDPCSPPQAASPAAVAGLGDLADLVTADRSGDLGPGPWTASLWFTVPGRVQSKSNFRKTKHSSWSDVATYEDLVHHLARTARTAAWPDADDDVPAAERPRIVVALLARTGLDAGNLSKSVLDACERVLFVTDAQVGCLTDLVVPARTGQGLLFAAAALPADAAPTDLIAASREVTDRLTRLTD